MIGQSVTADGWFAIDQERIDAFADTTDDHQWIHVDPERAAQGPFGATVAHGYLTLSLIPSLTDGLVEVGGTGPGRQLRARQGPVPAAGDGGLAHPGVVDGDVRRADGAGRPRDLHDHGRDRGRDEAGADRGDGRPLLRSLTTTSEEVSAPAATSSDVAGPCRWSVYETRSTTIAMPWPPPTHMVSRPNVASRVREAVQEGRGQAGAGAPERVADRDRAAVDVEPLVVDAERPRRREHLRGERLVELDQVDVVDGQARAGQGHARRVDRSEAHDLRRQAADPGGDDAGERGQAELVDDPVADHDDRRGAVVERAAVAGRDRAVGPEHRVRGPPATRR